MQIRCGLGWLRRHEPDKMDDLDALREKVGDELLSAYHEIENKEREWQIFQARSYLRRRR